MMITLQQSTWLDRDGWTISVDSRPSNHGVLLDAISKWCDENDIAAPMNGFTRFWFESEADANLVYLRFR
jgi:hypothetical protein